MATLVALYRTNELPFHLKRALENGVTKEELIELITHLAFYAGWPSANSAVMIARRVFADQTVKLNDAYSRGKPYGTDRFSYCPPQH